MKTKLCYKWQINVKSKDIAYHREYMHSLYFTFSHTSRVYNCMSSIWCLKPIGDYVSLKYTPHFRW